MPRSLYDEETPLLHGDTQFTPLPWFQFSLVLLVKFAEPLTAQVISPFTPQLIRDIGITHGNESQVGYYVGMMQSLFFLTEALTILQWSRLSDRIGRKPVVLFGTLGLSMSMYSFGLSKTFWGLVLTRSLSGALNGNTGVVKSMIAEMTDSTNIAQAYAYMPITWSAGGAIGPLIGGILARPAERFPRLFGNSEFLKKFPYFLPCAIPATSTALTFVLALFCLKETFPNPQPISNFLRFWGKSNERDLRTNTFENTSNDAVALSNNRSDEDSPLPLRQVLTYKVVLAAINYAAISLIEIALRAVQPLFFATPIHFGGLGLSPPTIGKILSFLGILNGLFQVFFFAKIHSCWGTRTVFLGGVFACLPCFALFPVINLLARHQGYSIAVWVAVSFQIVAFVFVNVSFGAIIIFIAAASPNRASLGATIGFSQMLVSSTRAIGPAMANSLFSFSIERGYLGGYLVYYILLVVTGVCIYLGCLLPR
ncbi:member of major facilitator superfamily multidrug-resistance, DHA1 sub-family [Crepidotus variabilis]|uniref:Member of major facilitator superfamily multidrug-resistance, DHA1 sub-family n=1 Tax=Crepidotus variabilis TaxID=179855 RepID=A0A9P6E3Y6_9AGAR|nr:member of major facilitator superfamily multidrug-resistance, DHA1 sub-family [Crepidotus variabilis]